jgi:Flp pilus assembly pilin Flp
MNALSAFAADESGAVTTDWIVLTAACVAMGLATIYSVSGGVEDLSGDTANVLSNYQIDDQFDG